MRVEYDKDPKSNNSKTRKKKRRSVRPGFIIFLIVLVIGVLATLSLTVWFNIETYSISGSSIYSREDIIRSSGIDIGDNMWLMSTSKTEERIETALPYIKNAEVKRIIPNGISIKVTADSEAAQIKTKTGYALVSSEFKVLDIVGEKKRGLPVIIASDISAKKGSAVEFSDKTQNNVLKSLTKIAIADSLYVTVFDVENNLDINFVINDYIYVHLGSYNNLERKMAHLMGMLESVEKNTMARIDLSNWSEDNKKGILVYEDITEYLQ